MPYTIKSGVMKYKDPATGNYVNLDALGDTVAIVQIEGAIAPDYSDLTFPVSAGKLCWHEGVLYAANQAINASESWTAAHWTATTIDGEISSLIDDTAGDGIENKTWSANKIYDQLALKVDEPENEGTSGQVLTTDGNGGRMWATVQSSAENFVTKDSVDNAGITDRTYTTKFGGQFSVTTAVTTGYDNPYAKASVTGRINKHYLHRVTFNDTEYILRTRLWYELIDNKVYEYLGNLGLYKSDVSGVPGGTDNVPFLIMSDRDNNSGIEVITLNAGTYTIKVEQINNTQKVLPSALIYGNSYVPLETNDNGGTFNGFSIGVNELSNKRSTFAFGYWNQITDQFSFGIGLKNEVDSGYAFGRANSVSGEDAAAVGLANNVDDGYAFGAGNRASNDGVAFGNGARANYGVSVTGRYNVEPTQTTYPQWQSNTTYLVGDIVNVNPFPTQFRCIQDHTSSSSFASDFTGGKWAASLAPASDSVFVVGNGIDQNDSSNALKIGFNGDAHFRRNIYVGCNPDSTGGTMLPKDVQVNGASVVNNGIANIPLATSSSFGAVKLAGAVKGSSDNPGAIYISEPADSSIKTGTSTSFVAPISKQHMATFYGLAKAAGDATQSASSNAVGTYTPQAKAAIQSMLGVESGATFIDTVSGTTPTIIGEPNVRYVCGEVSTITITPPSVGTISVLFTSGTTPAVLTLPNTVKFPSWVDLTTLDASTTYEIMITDGVYGGVMTWAE